MTPEDAINQALPELFGNKDLPEDLKKTFKGIHDMGHYWNAQTYTETPKEFIERRQVGKEKGTGNPVYADYIRQFYVIRELNRLYPGWEIKDYKLWYEPSIACYVCTGVLMVRYFDLVENRLMWRGIPGTGAQQVMSKADEATRPSKPDDMAKSPRTDLIKNCAYWLGIGFDVYSREIPPSMVAQFEALIEDWDERDYILARAEAINRKDDFEKFLSDIPSLSHTARLKELLEKVKELNPALYNNVHAKVWGDYQKLPKHQATAWLDGFAKAQVTTQTIKQKENADG